MCLLKQVCLTLVIAMSILSVGRSQSLDTSWLRTKTLANVLNPNLSVIGDMTVNTGPMKDSKSNRVSLRETEVGLQASVDPYARADFFVSFPDGEGPELEEGYASLLSLPWGIKARGGKFLANFGRLNMIHRGSEQPQVDSPLVLTTFLGEEGLNDTGAEISKVFAPMGLFTEISYSLLNGIGKEEKKEATTTTVTDTNGNVVTVAVKQPEEKTERQVRNFAHVSRIRFYTDFTDTTNMELGISGLLHQPKDKKDTKMGAIDVTFRWKPLQEGLYKSFIWRTEVLYSNRKLIPETNPITGAITTPERRLHRRGVYSYIEYQPAQRWRFGVRGDYVENPETADTTITLDDSITMRTVGRSITRAVSPYLSFTLTEFNRFRLQYQNKQVPGDDVEHRIFFEWSVVLGPHGAHPF